MKLRFSKPGFCVKESLGQAQFLRSGKQPGGRFFKPRFGSSTPALGQAGRSRCLRRRHNRRVPVADDRRAAETVRGLGQHGKLSIENHLIQGWTVMIARRYAVRLGVPLSSMVRMTWMVLFLEEPPTNCGSVNMVSRLWSWVSFTPFEDVLASL